MAPPVGKFTQELYMKRTHSGCLTFRDKSHFKKIVSFKILKISKKKKKIAIKRIIYIYLLGLSV